MNLKLLLGALAGAVVLMLWGAIFWMALASGSTAVRNLPNGDSLVAAMKSSITESGTYFWPQMDPKGTPEQRDEAVKNYENGPVVMVSYRADGINPLGGGTYLLGFVHFFFSALLVAMLMGFALPRLASYGSRFGFILLAGIFAAFSVDLAGPIWFHTVAGLPVLNMVYHITGWLMAALVMAAIIRPRPASALADAARVRAAQSVN